MMGEIPSFLEKDVRYVCYRCQEALKNSKDFIRHVEQKCEPVREWRCTDCPRTYRRIDRFKWHHKSVHSCSSGDCSHASDVEHKLPTRAAHGCGFCTHYFQSDLRGFLNHLIKHYEQGYTPAKLESDRCTLEPSYAAPCARDMVQNLRGSFPDFGCALARDGLDESKCNLLHRQP